MSVTVNYRFKVAGYNAGTWTPGTLLEVRELGFELDTGKVKLGDGVTTWGSLGYHYFWTTWARVDGKPTTLAGYGITDAVPTTRTVSTSSPLTGGGALSGNLTLGFTGAALTKTDDTNVTLTLGGTPASALAAATSLTLGWTGVLSIARGGTGGSTATAAKAALGIGTIASQNDTGLTLTDATLPRVSLVRSGVGTWHLGNQTAGGTTNTLQITFNSTSALEITTGNAATFRGTLSIAGHGTTASGANAFIDSTTGLLSRSTSSLLYKREVEDLDPAVADALLTLRPIWYRSAIDTDRQDWSWLGVSAEELASIEPRLVHWGYMPEDYDHRRKRERVLRKSARLRPVGVAYDRMTVPLLSIVQRLVTRVEALEQEVERLRNA